QTPQEATVATESPDVLVMRGVNGSYQGIAGALKFQARVRVLTRGGKLSLGKDTLTVSGAGSAVLLLAAATSYKNYKDVTGDPEARTRGQITAAANKSFEELLKDHVAEHRRLFRRVTLDLGTTPAARRPTDERVKHFADGND